MPTSFTPVAALTSALKEGFVDRESLSNLQLQRARTLLAEILPRNRFYARKFADRGIDASKMNALAELPFTTKAELIADQEASPPHGSVLTYSPTRYCRMHQTSGTAARPLRWLDTAESWDWLLECWTTIYRIAGVSSGDRLFFAFSFGPFLGFWTAFEAAARLGYYSVAGGGMSSTARLRSLLDNQATIILCTPTYALHLAEVAKKEGLVLAGSSVRLIIVAGEPGGSIPETRRRIEDGWQARVCDHNGLTEVGAVGVECQESPANLHILEADYIPEVVDPASGTPVPPGHSGELVLTNLGRAGSPLIRYRTGDIVRVHPDPCPCGRVFVRLQGGILGRTDDMIHLRGNNFYPSALEALLRRFSEIAEYRVEVDHTAALGAMHIEVEPVAGATTNGLADRVSRALHDEFLFRAEVREVLPGSLPRFEMKARRVVIKRS
jgi:phenylacetate-CoA ligase